MDLAGLLPEELFDEIEGKPQCKLSIVSGSNYESNCPELLGNYMLGLFQDEQGNYYAERSEKTPVGDYGWSWVSYWYVCNDNTTVTNLISESAREA